MMNFILPLLAMAAVSYIARKVVSNSHDANKPGSVLRKKFVVINQITYLLMAAFAISYNLI
jgi:hypothetical protein